MSLLSRINGAFINQPLRFVLMDNSSTTGGALTTLTPTSTGLKISVMADNAASGTAYSGANIQTIATAGTYVAPSTGCCRFGSVDQTNHPGVYELQLLNTALAPTNANYLIVTVQAPGSNCSPQSFIIDLSPQADIEAVGDTLLPSPSGGLLPVNVTQIGSNVAAVTKLLLEMGGRITGTVTAATYTPTTTSFECSDIIDSRSTPIFAMRGFLVTSSTGQLNCVGVILTDIVGTSGRRFTTTALPAALSSGDTIIIM